MTGKDNLYRELRELRFDLKTLIETRAGHDLTGCNNTVNDTMDLYASGIVQGEDEDFMWDGLAESMKWLNQLTDRNNIAMDDIYKRLEAIEARMQEATCSK